MRHLVTAREVTRTYPAKAGNPPVHALGPIDLDLVEGEFFTLVGPSGCGKSTLLDLIAGLGQASSGEIRIGGEPLAGKVPDGVGIVFQEDSSFPWLNVEDNIAFGLRRAGLPKAEIASRVEHALRLMGLAGFRKAFPRQLSGGMRQRVCIARTLVERPRLILMDEPFGALDQQTRLLMGDELLKLWRETGATIFLITHSLDEAAMLSDRIGVMSARPGRFIEIIETGWAPDRTSAMVAEEKFAEITARLWTHLRLESMKAMAEQQPVASAP